MSEDIKLTRGGFTSTKPRLSKSEKALDASQKALSYATHGQSLGTKGAEYEAALASLARGARTLTTIERGLDPQNRHEPRRRGREGSTEFGRIIVPGGITALCVCEHSKGNHRMVEEDLKAAGVKCACLIPDCDCEGYFEARKKVTEGGTRK
jgi:hypothetical protein